ncbi:Polysaccharide deacetylase [Caenispirillum salinarum AK4]|uniref:Chitooligosaccharide deacetylase n=1 Tax=Caenispirillum salinarum AK4 TaxID=1238182 RepID=K9H6R0_9PROT|nr:XrtA system polysaccharide deacetylase [Caenispirillum salinarum]EKV32734.1 Polysaccharide deacetylase [Caenispirillum salinarum AK4]
MNQITAAAAARAQAAPPQVSRREVPPAAPSRPGPRRDARGRIVNAMTVDVEDWFQVQALSAHVDRDSWDLQNRRVERNTDRILALFAEEGVSATFFTLGWVAERHPLLIRRIVDAGHELASHGLAHVPVHAQSADAFRRDIRHAKALLEDTGGVAVHGYRAATFSIGSRTPWAHQVLAEEGHSYSSSINPIRHDLYGAPDAPRFPHCPREAPDGFWEVPMTTVQVRGRNLPCAGGGFFRLLPYAVFRAGLRRVNLGEERPAVFYFHPWEVDPGQPRIAGLPWRSAFRHTVNLGRTEARLKRLLRDFAWDRMDRVHPGLVPADG